MTRRAKQRKDAGTLRDINTGNVIGVTDHLSREFLYQVQRVQARGKPFTVVSGPVRHTEVIELIDDLKQMGVQIVRWREMKPDFLLIVDAVGDELEDLRVQGLALAAHLMLA